MMYNKNTLDMPGGDYPVAQLEAAVLGLDVSTTVVGYCVLDRQNEVLTRGHVSLEKVEGLWDKLWEVSLVLKDLRSRFPELALICIEDAALRYGDRTTAKTIGMLIRFNAMVAVVVHNEWLGLEPTFVNPTSARKAVGVKLTTKKKAGGLSHKEQTFEFLRGPGQAFEAVDWPRKRTGKIRDECYDEVDAYVIAAGGRALKGS